MTAVFVNGVEQVTADAVGSIWVVLVFFQCTASDIIFTEPLACTAYDPQIVLTVNMEGVCIIGNGLFFCRREERYRFSRTGIEQSQLALASQKKSVLIGSYAHNDVRWDGGCILRVVAVMFKLSG